MLESTSQHLRSRVTCCMAIGRNQQPNSGDSFRNSFPSPDLDRFCEAPSPKQALTARECEVLALIAEGKTTKEVAWTLGIKFKTGACHRPRILGKLHAHNTADMTRDAISMGLITVRHHWEEGSQVFISPCAQRQQLAEAVQHHLRRVAELAHAEAEAIAGGNERVRMALEARTMNELGEKERAMSSLRRHREDHGC
jgi:DNA-binding CsgD family transcriptional regulator